MTAGASRRVLVVDDDSQIRELLISSLEFAGMSVTTASTARDGMAEISRRPFDLLLLDIGLPDLSGLEVLRLAVGAERRLPVILLTARDDLDDKIVGLKAGADDYITKPFHVSEVVARIEAVFRRRAPAQEEVIRVADLAIDTSRLTVSRGGEIIALTPTEFTLLSYLAENAGRVVSKIQILDAVWQYDFGGDSVVVERFVSNLRRKIDDGRSPLLRTVRGFGYSLGDPSDAARERDR